VAKTGKGEITTERKPYEGEHFILYDMPGRNDDVSYFTLDNIAFLKGLTKRVILIKDTVKEMTAVLRVLDDLNLSYDIVFNDFEGTSEEELRALKEQVAEQTSKADLKKIDHIWFVDAKNLKRLPDGLQLMSKLTEPASKDL
jgi:hypothetical protein